MNHELLSSKVILTAHVYSTQLSTPAKVGAVLSIHVTVPVTYHVFPSRSWNVNSKLPFPVNRYQVAFNHVTASSNHVMIAITFPLVNDHDHGE